jgi:hypothetical protein
VAVVGLGVGVWLGAANYVSSGRSTEAINTVARERALSPVSACLLTDTTGVSSSPASDVWRGVQDAAAAAKVRATFLPLVRTGSPQDEINALLAQKCSVILGVGNKAVAAVTTASSGAHPGVQFAVTGPGPRGAVGFAPTRDGAHAAVAPLLAAAEGGAS